MKERETPKIITENAEETWRNIEIWVNRASKSGVRLQSCMFGPEDRSLTSNFNVQSLEHLLEDTRQVRGASFAGHAAPSHKNAKIVTQRNNTKSSRSEMINAVLEEKTP